MKRSLIVGAVLTAIILLSFIIAPSAANDSEDMDTQASVEMQTIHAVSYDHAPMSLCEEDASDPPKIKENDEAVGGFEEESKEEKTYTTYYTEDDVTMLARLIYNECRGVESVTEQACVVWTVLNRVDGSDGASISGIVTEENQFAYSHAPLWDNLLWLAEDVLSRWNAELNGEASVGRVLPADYKWFSGDGEHNHFRNAYSGNYDIWDYSLPSPYES